MSDKVTFRVNYTEVMNDKELAKLVENCQKEAERGHDVSLAVVMTKKFDVYDEANFLQRLLEVLPFKMIFLEDDAGDAMYCQQAYELQEFLSENCIGYFGDDDAQYYSFNEKVITLGYPRQNCMHISSYIPGTMRHV